MKEDDNELATEEWLDKVEEEKNEKTFSQNLLDAMNGTIKYLENIERSMDKYPSMKDELNDNEE